MPGATGVEAHAADSESASPGRDAASARKNAAELRSPGTRSPKGSSGPGWTVTSDPFDTTRDPAHAEHPLGVVAGRHRFDDRGRPVGREPGEQDGRFHLRARHR